MKTTKHHRLWRFCLGFAALWALLLVGAAFAQDAAKPQSSSKIYGNQQLDQMLAPVALYPDPLLSQIFMASTYPSDVADAATWSAANPKAQGDAAVKQVANQPWDPSVQSLVAFPQLMAQLKQQPDWVQNLGDAFLAQPDDVMASVQRLRAQAQKAGNLKSTEQQKVIAQSAPAASGGGSTTYIEIQPTHPEVVYVPSYNSSVIYGSWPYPAYPPTYWPPPYGYAYPVGSALAAGLAFGVGIAVVNSLWGGCNWGGGSVDINVNRYNNINSNHRISGNGNGNARWNHDPSNRRGTPYRDAGSREKFGQGVGGASQREQFRGRDAAGDANRQRSLESFDRSTNNGSSMEARRSAGQSGAALNRPGDGPGANREGNGGQGRANGNRPTHGDGGMNRNDGGGQTQRRPSGDTGARQGQASGVRDNAFGGGQSPGNGNTQSNRGQSSQRSMNSNHGGGTRGGHQMSRPVPSRGGGGGGRRRVGV